MNAEQFFGKDIVKGIKEMLRYAKQGTKEERMILVNVLRDEAKKQQKNIVQIALLNLADYVESLEEEPILEKHKKEPTSFADEVRQKNTLIR